MCFMLCYKIILDCRCYTICKINSQSKFVGFTSNTSGNNKPSPLQDVVRHKEGDPEKHTHFSLEDSLPPCSTHEEQNWRQFQKHQYTVTLFLSLEEGKT